MPEAGTKPLSCDIAVRYMDYLFSNGATNISDDDISDLQGYKEAIRKERNIFEKAIKEAEPNPTRQLVDVALLQYGKYSPFIMCCSRADCFESGLRDQRSVPRCLGCMISLIIVRKPKKV